MYRRDGRELLFHHRSDPYQVRDWAEERRAATATGVKQDLKALEQVRSKWLRG